MLSFDLQEGDKCLMENEGMNNISGTYLCVLLEKEDRRKDTKFLLNMRRGKNNNIFQ